MMRSPGLPLLLAGGRLGVAPESEPKRKKPGTGPGRESKMMLIKASARERVLSAAKCR